MPLMFEKADTRSWGRKELRKDRCERLALPLACEYPNIPQVVDVDVEPLDGFSDLLLGDGFACQRKAKLSDPLCKPNREKARARSTHH